MLETPEDLRDLQALLDASLARSGPHLRGIIHTGERTPSAETITRLLTGMKVLVVATVSADGRPRTSAVDGHFLRGRWVFTTSGDAVKSRDLRQRPAVSASYVDGERFALFTHGNADFLDVSSSDDAWVETHLAAHYGESPSAWGPDISYIRINPRWAVAYAFDVDALS
jgi:general stress protein 26